MAKRSFDGRVVGIVRYDGSNETDWVVAPKSTRFINIDIANGIDFAVKNKNHTLECLYERSCGAVVFRFINGERRFLLIKNKRSCHWGFPKGHVENDETDEETAKREVLEETGIHIKIFPGFKHKSEYTIRGRIEKSVLIFLATTDDTQTVIQPEEIEDYIWLGYDNAISTLNYPNDKDILSLAKAYITKNNI